VQSGTATSRLSARRGSLMKSCSSTAPTYLCWCCFFFLFFLFFFIRCVRWNTKESSLNARKQKKNPWSASKRHFSPSPLPRQQGVDFPFDNNATGSLIHVLPSARCLRAAAVSDMVMRRHGTNENPSTVQLRVSHWKRNESKERDSLQDGRKPAPPPPSLLVTTVTQSTVVMRRRRRTHSYLCSNDNAGEMWSLVLE